MHGLMREGSGYPALYSTRCLARGDKMKLFILNLFGILALLFVCCTTGAISGFLWAFTSSGLGSDSSLGAFSDSYKKGAFFIGFIIPIVYLMLKRKAKE
jgi:hypothetical protein